MQIAILGAGMVGRAMAIDLAAKKTKPPFWWGGTGGPYSPQKTIQLKL
ncbi:MAG: hypothetical protein IPI88_11145 [Chitinophagaceae bacterium]|nr:hypothetical protein [Chitinophagaceae bacterium]